MNSKTDISVKLLIGWIGIGSSKYYDWKHYRPSQKPKTPVAPKPHWLLDWEWDAVVRYAKDHRGEGYRRLTYRMLDEDIVAISPATTYRILKAEGLLNRWNRIKKNGRKTGFEQPNACHEHWHIDIKYVNFKGTFLFLISLIDGYSRYIIHHQLRMQMEEYDVQVVVAEALELFPGVHPRIISDNGSQFIAKEFSRFIRFSGLQHVRTSVAYPQSNGKIERFHRTINEECLEIASFITLADARKQIAQYIHHYNTVRLHGAIGYLSPEDVLLGRQNQRLMERKIKLEKAKKEREEKKKVA